MWGTARARGLVVVIGAALGAAPGCDLPASVQAEIVCTTVCRCFAPDAVLDQDECVTECVGQIWAGLR